MARHRICSSLQYRLPKKVKEMGEQITKVMTGGLNGN